MEGTKSLPHACQHQGHGSSVLSPPCSWSLAVWPAQRLPLHSAPVPLIVQVFSQALIITSICLVQLCSSLTHLLSSGPSGPSLCLSLAYWSPFQGAQRHFEREVTSHSPSLVPWVQPFQLCSAPARCSWGCCCHQESSSSATMKTLGPAALKNPQWPNQHKGLPTSPSPQGLSPSSQPGWSWQ